MLNALRTRKDVPIAPLYPLGRRYIRTKRIRLPKSLLVNGRKPSTTAKPGMNSARSQPSTLPGTSPTTQAPPTPDISTIQRIMEDIPLHQQQVLREVLAKVGPKPILEAIADLQSKIIKSEQETQKDPADAAEHTSPYSRKLAVVKYHFDFYNIASETEYIESFWLNLHDLTKVKRRRDDPVPLEFLCNVFESAKRQPWAVRSRCIKLVGDMIYGLTNMRMDPFNEAEYIDALCVHGEFSKGMKLWESRKNKPDVQQLQIYWPQTGILALQRSHQLARAEALAREMDEKLSYVSPKVILGFINVYSRSSQATKVKYWYQRLLALLGPRRGQEIPHSSKEERKNLTLGEASQYLNCKLIPTQEDLQEALVAGLDNCLWDFSSQVLDDFRNLDIQPDLDTTLKIFDSSTRKLVGRDSRSALSRKALRQARRESAQYIAVLVSSLVETHPEVLSKPEFYLSWLRGMAGMELAPDCLNLLSAMQNTGVLIDHRHFQLVVSCLLKCNDLERAYELLTKMEASRNDADSPFPRLTPQIYASFISYYAKRSDEKQIRAIIGRMEHFGVEHSEATFSTLIFYYYRHKQFDQLFKLFHAVFTSQNKFRISMTNYNYRALWLMIRDYNRQTRVHAAPHPDIRLLFRAMVHDNKFRRSLFIYEYCLQTFVLAEDYIGAFAVLRYMERVNNVDISVDLIMSLHVIASRKVSKNHNFVLQPRLSSAQPNQPVPPIPWQIAATNLATALGLGDPKKLILEADALSRQFEREL